jgi:hypothetical protein
VTAGFYPLTGNPSGFLTASALTPYLTKADNLGSLTNFATARDNLNLGTLNNPTFAGLTLQGSGANVGQYTPTSLSLTHTTFGSFVISPSSGITFPDTSIQTTAFVAGSGLPTGGTVGQVLTKNSGTNFDASFATLIPGDRYLTTSTTSNTLSNTNKTFTIGTGLSYTPTQSITISYDASNHMHGEVLTYNSGTGVLTVDINHHTGSGTYASWTVNVGGVVPAASVAWGGITGTLGNQTDLATALNAKLEVTTAASTYFTIASAAGKANLSGATFTGKVNLPDLGVNTPSLNLGGTALSTTATSAASGDVWISGATSPKLTYKVGGANLYCATSNLTNTFTSSQIIDVTTATSAALRVTQKGTANAIEVEDSTTPDATRFVVDQFGKVGIGVAPDTSAALKVDTNGIMFGNGSLQTVAAGPSWSEAQIYSFTLGSTFTSNTNSFSVSSTSSPDMTISFSFGNAPALAYMLNQLGVTGRIYALDVNGVYDTFNQSFDILSSGTATATQSTSAQLNGQVYDVYLQFEPNGPFGAPAQFYVGQYTVT